MVLRNKINFIILMTLSINIFSMYNNSLKVKSAQEIFYKVILTNKKKIKNSLRENIKLNNNCNKANKEDIIKNRHNIIISLITIKKNILNISLSSDNIKESFNDNIEKIFKLEFFENLSAEEKNELLFTIIQHKDLNIFTRSIINNNNLKSYLDTKTNTNLNKLIIYASLADNKEIIKLLIENNFNINEQTSNGWTPLMFASKLNSVEIAKNLIKKNANLNLQNQDGLTALMIAAKLNNIEIVQLLIDNGADINIKDNLEQTALSYSIKEKNLDVNKLLIDKI